MDQLPGKHRLVFDATTPVGADTVRRYVDNYFSASKTGYGLEASDLAVIVILRHHATPFAYNDAMWAKHGAAMSDELKFVDPATSQAPNHNVYNTSETILPPSRRGRPAAARTTFIASSSRTCFGIPT